MDEKLNYNISSATWYPKESSLALWFLIIAAILELGMHKIALFYHQPSHELADIPSRFAIISPLATFSLYFLDILAFILLLYFSIHLLKIPVKSKNKRLSLGIILFFSYPILALNTLLLPTNLISQLIWYYMGILTFLILISLSFWLLSSYLIKIKSLLLWHLLLAPSIFLMISKFISPENSQTSSSLANLLFKIGNYTFIYQSFLWPFLILNKKKISLSSLILSLIPTISITAFFRYNYSSAVTTWFSGLRITLPLELNGQFLYAVAIWIGIYTIIEIFKSSGKWNFLLGISLIFWAIQGYFPYTVSEIIPLILVAIMLALSLSMLSIKHKKLTGIDKKINWKSFLKKNRINFISEKAKSKNLNEISGTYKKIPFKLILKTSRNKIKNFKIVFGICALNDPDWIATSIPLIPVQRHIFPSLPKLYKKEHPVKENISIWDRNFFSDDLLKDNLDKTLKYVVAGEIKLWWTMGVVYESSLPPISKEHLNDSINLVRKLSLRSHISTDKHKK
jgi:hypothetical protein